MPFMTGICGYMDWRSKLIRCREALNLSQDELAERIGLQGSRIGKWERGEGELKLRQALALSKALGVPLDYFADDELDAPPPPPESVLTEDEKHVVVLYRALRMSRDDALRALNLASVGLNSVGIMDDGASGSRRRTGSE